jgi:chemotaxis protein CheX
MSSEMRQELITDLVTPFIQKSKMDVRFLTPFLKAAIEVLTAELGGPVRRGELSLQRSAYTTAEVNVLITLVGRVQGVVIYGLSQATALAIVSQIMGQPFDSLDNLAQSGVGELGNVITGRASTLLANEGYASQLSVPMLVIGKAKISLLDFPRLVVPLLIQHGQIDVHLALREVAA